MTRYVPPGRDPNPPANKALAIFMVVLVLFGALVVGVTLAASSLAGAQPQTETVTIDADHGLADQTMLDRWEGDTTTVSASNVGGLDLRVQLSKTAGPTGLDERWQASSANTYLRITYNEEIPRTIRLYIPKEYFTPRSRGDLRAENTDVTADLAPVKERRYTAVTVRLTGETDSVFAVSSLRGHYFGLREDVDRFINRTTGFDLPDLSFGSNDAEWQFVPDHALAGGNTTHTIPLNDSHDPDDLTIQYARPTDDGDEHWLAVQDCDGDAAVCRFQKRGDDSAVHLLSTTDDPPAIRYRYGDDTGAAARSVWDDLASMPGRLADTVSSLWPFGGGGD